MGVDGNLCRSVHGTVRQYGLQKKGELHRVNCCQTASLSVTCEGVLSHEDMTHDVKVET